MKLILWTIYHIHARQGPCRYVRGYALTAKCDMEVSKRNATALLSISRELPILKNEVLDASPPVLERRLRENRRCSACQEDPQKPEDFLPLKNARLTFGWQSSHLTPEGITEKFGARFSHINAKQIFDVIDDLTPGATWTALKALASSPSSSMNTMRTFSPPVPIRSEFLRASAPFISRTVCQCVPPFTPAGRNRLSSPAQKIFPWPAPSVWPPKTAAPDSGKPPVCSHACLIQQLREMPRVRLTMTENTRPYILNLHSRHSIPRDGVPFQHGKLLHRRRLRLFQE